MTSLKSLRHVSAAIHHAELFADEAEDLGEKEVAVYLRERAAQLGAQLESALAAIDDVEPLRLARQRAHVTLAGAFHESTVTLERILPQDQVMRLLSGGHLDVVERVRFRLRNLPRDVDDVRALLERALFAYDSAVDLYLLTCGEAQGRKERVIVESQALRLELERTKQRLLLRAGDDSAAYKRIKRRAVRTKRPRWVNEARARTLLQNMLTT
jgi:hypothetical protein